MTCFAAHRYYDVPALRGEGIFHQVEDESCPNIARGLEAKGGDLVGQRQIVVDRLGCVCCADAYAEVLVCIPGDTVGGVRCVVTANGEKATDSTVDQGLTAFAQERIILGWVCARRVQNRATTAVDSRDILEAQAIAYHLALHQVLEAFTDADDFHAVVERLDCRCMDDAVDTRRWAATHEDSQFSLPGFIDHAHSKPFFVGVLVVFPGRALSVLNRQNP